MFRQRTLFPLRFHTAWSLRASIPLILALGLLSVPLTADAKPQVNISCQIGTSGPGSGQINFTLTWTSGTQNYSPDDTYVSIMLFDQNDNEVAGYPADLNGGNAYQVPYDSQVTGSASYGPISGGIVGLQADADYNSSGCDGAATFYGYDPCSGCYVYSPCATCGAAALTDTTPEFTIDDEPVVAEGDKSFLVPLDITNKTGSGINVHLVYCWYYRTTASGHLMPLKWQDASQNAAQISHRGQHQPVAAGQTVVATDCRYKPSGAPAGSEVIVAVHARTRTYVAPTKYIVIEIDHQ